MPASVLLVHGADFIKYVSLPVGMFTKEALEARNKDLRKCLAKIPRKVRTQGLRCDKSSLICNTENYASEDSASDTE